MQKATPFGRHGHLWLKTARKNPFNMRGKIKCTCLRRLAVPIRSINIGAKGSDRSRAVRRTDNENQWSTPLGTHRWNGPADPLSAN